MPRIPCKIKWDGDAFKAFNIDGSPIPIYSNLIYGKVDTGKDDPTESIKGLLPSKLPDTVHICDGFCDIP